MHPSITDWLEIIVCELDCDMVQYSWDILDLFTPDDIASAICTETRDAALENNVEIETTRTGYACLTYNLLLHPDGRMRDAACSWFLKMIRLTKIMGAKATGGYIGMLSAKDVNDTARREEIESDIQKKIVKMAKSAADNQLEYLMVLTSPNPHIIPTEPEHALKWVESLNRNTQLPVLISPDTSHLVRSSGAADFENKLYIALEMLAPVSPVIHLKQTDGIPGHYWPFTDEYNRRGVVDGSRVVESLDRGGAKDVSLVLEPVWVAKKPPTPEFLYELAESVKYWKQYV